MDKSQNGQYGQPPPGVPPGQYGQNYGGQSPRPGQYGQNYGGQGGLPPGQYAQAQPMAHNTVIVQNQVRPTSWMAFSIFTLLCCFFPVGIAALVFSCMVNTKFDEGDVDGAVGASKVALYLNIASIVCAVVISIIIVIIYFTVIANAASTYTNLVNTYLK